MNSLLLIGAAAISASISGPIARMDDYPEQLWRDGKTGANRIELVVAPTGAVIGCSILIPSKYPAFDTAACRAGKRAKASPAKDQMGEATYGVRKLWVMWMRGPVPLGLKADTTLSISKMPAGVRSGAISWLALVVGPSGHIDSCDVEESSGSVALDKAACNAVLQSAQLPTVVDQGGAPVRSVRSFSVQFTDGSAAR